MKSALLALALMTSAAMAADPAVTAAASKANTFASKLYGSLASGKGNLFFAPYSIDICLSMVASGARNETERQMADALSEPSQTAERDMAAAKLRAALDELRRAGDITFDEANRVWLQKNYKILEAFRASITNAYGADFAPADFGANAEKCRGEINGWVEKATRGKIKDLIPQGALNGLTRMVLVNAVYFYGSWDKAFKAEATTDDTFKSADGDVKVRMMHARLEHLSAREEDGLQVVDLPYKGRRAVMTILLPAEGGLKALENRIAKDGIDVTIGRLEPSTVRVSLPKFKLEQQFSLGDTLVALGMRNAFSVRDADFSGMTGTKDLYISAVVHKAFVQVDEKGTEAAAATGAIMMTRAMPMPQKEIVLRVDRPCVFLIRDRETGAVLFMGRLAKP